MTIAEILANEELRRAEFPVVRDSVFLGHAGVCPLPRRAAEAIHDYTRQAAEHDQEEAYAFEHIVTARRAAARLLNARPEVTERPEAVEAGSARIVGTDAGRIVEEAARLLKDQAAYRAMSALDNPFGDGHAAERIVKILAEVL